MKNLFDYATKELSQDAFLIWLFENYDDPEIGGVSNSLLGKFCNFKDGEKIKLLKTKSQWCKIDISVWITTTLGRAIALFIEDKTFSNEHSQLSVYNSHTDGVHNREIYKVFYKTDFIELEEKTRIDVANAQNKFNWKIFNIEDIYSFFKQYTTADNLILSQYAEHIAKIYNAATNTQKPQNSNDNIDWLAWKSYFNNVIIPALKGNGAEYQCSSWKAGQYPYVVLYIKKLGYGDRKIPYLEMRSRDCVENNFKATILCYGLDNIDILQQQILIDNVKAHPEWECKYLRQHKQGAVNYFPKQVGFSRDGLIAKTDKEFIALVENHIKYYLEVMKDWK